MKQHVETLISMINVCLKVAFVKQKKEKSLIICGCCFDGDVLYEMLYRYLPFGRAAALTEILRKI
jgi:hypothetical protein